MPIAFRNFLFVFIFCLFVPSLALAASEEDADFEEIVGHWAHEDSYSKEVLKPFSYALDYTGVLGGPTTLGGGVKTISIKTKADLVINSDTTVRYKFTSEEIDQEKSCTITQTLEGTGQIGIDEKSAAWFNYDNGTNVIKNSCNPKKNISESLKGKHTAFKMIDFKRADKRLILTPRDTGKDMDFFPAR